MTRPTPSASAALAAAYALLPIGIVLIFFVVGSASAASIPTDSAVGFVAVGGGDPRSAAVAGRARVFAPPHRLRSAIIRLSSSTTDVPSSSSSPSWSSSTEDQTRRDVLAIASHLLACASAAVVTSAWEDYDCSYLKPEVTALRRRETEASSIWGAATRGMGRGASDRLDDGYVILPEVRSYNEIMEEHRTATVPRWAGAQAEVVTEEDVRRSVSAIYSALSAVLTLKSLSADYAWDDVRTHLDSSALNSDLEIACSTLRSASSYLPTETRDLIGFHWGSCAWRHCGALADTQEALAELRTHGTGMYEPFESAFVLDVVERSLRDILTAVPVKWHDEGERGRLPGYVPYKSQSEMLAGMLGDDFEINDPTIDVEFLEMLKELRNQDFSSEDEEDDDSEN